MTWEAWFIVALLALMIYALVRRLGPTDVIMMGSFAVLAAMSLFSDRFLSPHDLAASFGEQSIIAIGILFIVSAGLAHTGAMTLLIKPLLGQPRSTRIAQLRLMAPVMILSAFMNNTPVVAVFLPIVRDWCKQRGLSPSHLFIPLSYAAIFGGTCTLIGTSTNLFVKGMFENARQEQAAGLIQGSLNMFTIAPVAIPAALIGMVYLILVSPKLLKDRRPKEQQNEDGSRQYTVEMLVQQDSPLHGKTIEQAGLRHLPGLYLMDVQRDSQQMIAVGPDFILQSCDRLIFVGVVQSVVDLQKIRGLIPASGRTFKINDTMPNRCLVEAVVSHHCPLVGSTIRQGRFRTVYNAAVIAVHRGAEHIADQKIGDIVLRAGDTLLLETHPHFAVRQRDRRDFYLVSTIQDSKPISHDKAWIAIAALVAMVVCVSLGWVSLMVGALLAGGIMVAARCCSAHQARSSVDWQVLIVIGAAIGIGGNVTSTGLAQHLADWLTQITTPFGPWAILAGIYLLTMIFTELIGHIGAATLAFPIALASAITASQSQGDPSMQQIHLLPYVITIMMAASSSFATPMGYQTNLMVYGPGGYRYSDYIRIGLPLNLIVMAITVTLTPLIWPL